MATTGLVRSGTVLITGDPMIGKSSYVKNRHADAYYHCIAQAPPTTSCRVIVYDEATHRTDLFKVINASDPRHHSYLQICLANVWTDSTDDFDHVVSWTSRSLLCYRCVGRACPIVEDIKTFADSDVYARLPVPSTVHK